jgi:hypothetical protein
MFLNLSPLVAHLNESLCSLRFATKASIQRPRWQEMSVLLMLYAGTGQQHTNWNCKKASQEHLMSSLHSRLGPPLAPCCQKCMNVFGREKLDYNSVFFVGLFTALQNPKVGCWQCNAWCDAYEVHVLSDCLLVNPLWFTPCKILITKLCSMANYHVMQMASIFVHSHNWCHQFCSLSMAV